MFKKSILMAAIILVGTVLSAQRPRELGIRFGVMDTGPLNAITDVPGVLVGQKTIISGDSVHTGVTALLPHSGNIFQEKVPAGIFIGNGYGKMTGYPQVRELGEIETPIILTNTLSVPTAANALITYTLQMPGNERVGSVNAVVGETNDGGLNDIRGRHVTESDVLDAIDSASSGEVEEGNVGAGTGTSCLGYKGGIGTSSRVLPDRFGGYIVGVLTQTNFGGILTIDGVPVGIELGRYNLDRYKRGSQDGSCMMIVFTNAPLDSRNLTRLAKRAMLGLSRTGGISSNGSGDFVIAVSTAEELRIPNSSRRNFTEASVLRNDRMSMLFQAVVEATEEAIINSLFAAETISSGNNTREALPVDEVMKIMQRYGR